MNDYEICHICTIETNLIQIECGHKFCNKCLEQWFNINPKCPLCLQDISFEYKSKLFVKNAIKFNYEFRKKNYYLRKFEMLIGILLVIYQIYILKNIEFTINDCLIIIDVISIIYDIYLKSLSTKIIEKNATNDINFKNDKDVKNLKFNFFQIFITFFELFFNIFWFPISSYFIYRNSTLKYFRIGYYFL